MPAKKPSKTPSLEASVKPYEATKLAPIAPSEAFDDAVKALAIACNGCVYMGSDIEAQLRAIRFLRTRPDVVAALGIAAS